MPSRNALLSHNTDRVSVLGVGLVLLGKVYVFLLAFLQIWIQSCCQRASNWGLNLKLRSLGSMIASVDKLERLVA